SAARKRLERLVRVGVGDLAPYAKRGASQSPVRVTLLRQVELLAFLTRELPAEVNPSPAVRSTLRRASEACQRARRPLLGEARATLEPFEGLAAERGQAAALSPAALAVVLPLVSCIQTVVLGVRQLLAADVVRETRAEHARAAGAGGRPSKTE